MTSTISMPRVIDSKHNAAPSDLEVVAERLADQEKELRLLIKSLPAPKSINDEKDAGVATDAVKSIISLNSKVADIHKTVKKPYLDCGRVVDGWKTRWETELSQLRAGYAVLLTKFLEERAAAERARQLEQAKAERERSEKLALEAQAHEEAGLGETAGELIDAAIGSAIMADRIEDKVCTATPSQLAKTRSFSGASASQQLKWIGTIENISAIPLETLRPYFSNDVLQTAVNAFVRDGGRELDGVKIEQEPQLRVR